MAIDLSQELDFAALFDSLLHKTQDGKLVWHETADEETFVATVKGRQTFELTLESPKTNGHAAVYGPIPVLKVKDSDGKIMYESPHQHWDTAAFLYDLATRIARKVDDRLQASLQLLEEL